MIFSFKNRKSEHHHCIPDAEISLGINFHFGKTILNSGTKFAQKTEFPVKSRKSERHH